MANLLDQIPRTPLLEGVDYWPKSATREEWFALTRDLIATTIEEMGEYLYEAKLALVEEYFMAEASTTYIGDSKGFFTNENGKALGPSMVTKKFKY